MTFRNKCQVILFFLLFPLLLLSLHLSLSLSLFFFLSLSLSPSFFLCLSLSLSLSLARSVACCGGVPPRARAGVTASCADASGLVACGRLTRFTWHSQACPDRLRLGRGQLIFDLNHGLRLGRPRVDRAATAEIETIGQCLLWHRGPRLESLPLAATWKLLPRRARRLRRQVGAVRWGSFQLQASFLWRNPMKSQPLTSDCETSTSPSHRYSGHECVIEMSMKSLSTSSSLALSLSLYHLLLPTMFAFVNNFAAAGGLSRSQVVAVQTCFPLINSLTTVMRKCLNCFWTLRPSFHPPPEAKAAPSL